MKPTDPLEALELWKSFVCGEWTLLDRYVRDGEEVIVACCGTEAARRNGLTAREGQVAIRVGRGASNKLVAFELGISAATVAALLRRAIAKLGIASRLELVALLGRAETVAT